MPLYSAEALVLRTYKLGEADRIVVFLTRDRGKKRGVARGAARSRRRFGGALEPMTRVNVAYFEKEQRELVSLNYAELLRSPLSAIDPDALGYVGYFAELIDESAPEADPSERLFRLGASVVEAMAQGVAAERLARYFEYWLLRLHGVYPSAEACQRCGAVLDAEGAWLARPAFVLLCGRCGGTDGPPDLSRPALGFLRRAARLAPERLGGIEFGAVPNRELERVHRALIAAHLERELRSVRVLREWMPEP
jgi:DNA repair protein RecO (recombination protein O)